MKGTRKLYLLRTIKKNIVSFLAVAMMVATGISIYLGDHSAAKAILEKANTYFIENKLQTLEISSSYGITIEDMKAMEKQKGVDVVEGGYSSVVFFEHEDDSGKIPVHAYSLLDSMNLPVVCEGSLPLAENELAVEEKMAKQREIRVGDKITIEHEGQLKADEFVVTAIINQPSYSCQKAMDSRGINEVGLGTVQYYISLNEVAFEPAFFNETYTTAYVKSNSLDQYFYFSKEYQEREQELKERLVVLGKERQEGRLEEVQEEGSRQFQRAEEALEEYEAILTLAKELLPNLLNMDAEITNWKQAKEYLDTNHRFYSYYYRILEELEGAEETLLQKKKEIEQGKIQLEQLKEEPWLVSIRNDIGDVRSIAIIVETLYGLGYSMALIFVLVSVIVCYSAISRMINEQRPFIGMQKALGFSEKEILHHYMSYSALCGLLGVAEGWIASIFTVQALSLNIYEDVFLFGTIPYSFDQKQAILISMIFILIFLFASFFACKKEISLPAMELLRGEIPQREKSFWFEKLKGYHRLKLYHRTMIKNALSDFPRMMTTIVGVAGCILLLVISFTMLITMKESSKVQFERYFLYENRLVVDGRKASMEEYETLLQKEGISYLRIQDKLRLYRQEGGNWQTAHVVVVPQKEELSEFIKLEDPYTRKPVEVPEEGMLVSLKCAENHNLEKGNTLQLMAGDTSTSNIPFQGTIEHYLGYNLFVLSETYYEQVMKEEADRCVFLLKGNVEGLYEKVKDLEGFLSLQDNREYENTEDGLVMVVMICFVFAAIMAVLVMLNQNVMYINKKAKELSVMRINGFTIRETEDFVSKDNLILTFLGIILGWILGMGLGYIITLVMEVASTHYIRTPSLRACLIAGGIGAIFAWLMNKIAIRRIGKLNLTDVNSN